jgi:hypothetical protein
MPGQPIRPLPRHERANGRVESVIASRETKSSAAAADDESFAAEGLPGLAPCWGGGPGARARNASVAIVGTEPSLSALDAPREAPTGRTARPAGCSRPGSGCDV